MREKREGSSGLSLSQHARKKNGGQKRGGKKNIKDTRYLTPLHNTDRRAERNGTLIYEKTYNKKAMGGQTKRLEESVNTEKQHKREGKGEEGS